MTYEWPYGKNVRPPFGLHSCWGIISINEAKNGLACDCTYPACGAQLVECLHRTPQPDSPLRLAQPLPLRVD